MNDQHVTQIEDDLDPDTPTGRRYQPRCSCTWAGTPTYDRKRAVKEADMHRTQEAVRGL